MRRKFFIFLMGMFFVGSTFAGVSSADMKEDTLALVKKGAEYIQKNGVEKAAEAFQGKEFKKGDLYLFAYDYKGNCLAQGAKPQLIGKNLWNLKDPSGKFIIRESVEIAKKGGGWLEYQWMHPYKKKLMEKESYIMPIEGQDVYVACGFFKD